MKKILICSSILIVTLFFAGCDLFSTDSSTTMTLVNDSSETINLVEVNAILGAQARMAMLVNSLEDGDTVVPNGKVVFKLAPKLADNSELAVGVTVVGNTNPIREYLTYSPESDFTLHFLGSSEDTQFSISGEGASLDSGI